MTFKQLHTMLLFIVCAALAACTDEVGGSLSPDYDKTPIELSLRGMNASPMTRTVITDGTDNMQGFTTKDTRLYLYLKSEDGNEEHGHIKADDLYALTAVLAKKITTVGQKSEITTASERQLYWDDAHARDSKLTVYACGYANREASSMKFGETEIHWSKSNEPKKIDFQTTAIGTTVAIKIDDNTTESSFNGGDFIFSNNISDENRLKYNTDPGTPTTYHKFDKGDLIFYHALSKLTFHVVMGEGFTEDDFLFKANTNIALKGFYGSGTFDLEQGEFTSTEVKTINHIAPENKDDKLKLKTDDTRKYYELTTYLVPGTDLTASPTVDDALTLIIKDSPYKVSMRTLYDKILANTDNQVDASTVNESVLTGGTSLKAGVNYLFTLTIGKAGIDNITAQVADWEEVSAENIDPKSDNIQVTTAIINDHKTNANNFDLYRMPYISPGDAIDMSIKNYDWAGRYTDKATLSGPSAGVWSTNWYFESNKHFYHFRAVSPKAASQGATTVKTGTEPADDYLTLATGQYSSTPASSYTDVLWGAPFTGPTGAGSKYGYDPGSKGFDGTTEDHQIHHGIVTTESRINLLLFHMMSEVTFNITTTTGDDQVLLRENAKDTKVELIGYYPEGHVLMGNGLVQPAGVKSAPESGYNLALDNYTAQDGETAAKSVFHYGVVPQSLENVKLRITTPDNNQYTVDLKNAKTSSITTNNLANPYQRTGDKYIITHWYPGFKYNYSFTLKKSGITNLTATIVEWETVTTDNEDVQIQ